MKILNRAIVSLTAIVAVCMFAAGIWLTLYLRNSDIQSAARMAAGYFQLMFHGGADGADSAALAQRDLRGIVVPPGRIEAVVLWLPDGTILSAETAEEIGQKHDNPNLGRVLREGIVAQITHSRSNSGDGGGGVDAVGKGQGQGAAQPLLEIYVPLDPGPEGAPRLIGEFYLDASELLATEVERARLIWAGVATTGGTIMALLLYILLRARRLVVAQQVELDARLAHTEKLLTINRALRNEADCAREDLVRGNEAVLNALASDLHDGPLQMLAVAALSLDDVPEPGPRQSIGALLARSMAELRGLSVGMGLPELPGLTTHETIHLAVSRHSGMTGSEVVSHLPPALPDLETATQICLFRVIQEGLINAFKHGHDRQPELHVRLRSDALIVAVLSRNRPATVLAGVMAGGGQVGTRPVGARLVGGGLGLQGLRRRVTALGGRIRCRQNRALGHVLLLTRLPLR